MSAVKLAVMDRGHNHLRIQEMTGVAPADLDAPTISAALAEVRGLPSFQCGRHVALIVIPGGKS